MEYIKLLETEHYLVQQSIIPYYNKYQYLISDFEEDTRAQGGSQDQGERLRRSWLPPCAPVDSSQVRVKIALHGSALLSDLLFSGCSFFWHHFSFPDRQIRKNLGSVCLLLFFWQSDLQKTYKCCFPNQGMGHLYKYVILIWLPHDLHIKINYGSISGPKEFWNKIRLYWRLSPVLSVIHRRFKVDLGIKCVYIDILAQFYL